MTLILAVLLIEIFHLSPPAGILKFGVVLLPFAADYFCIPGHPPAAIQTTRKALRQLTRF